MNQISRLVHRFAKENGYCVEYVNEPFGPKSNDYERIWYFSLNGKPVDWLCDLCDTEIIDRLYQLEGITLDEFVQGQKEIDDGYILEELPRLPYGKESNEHPLYSNCPSCGIKIGELHKPGCILEVCPSCEKRLLMCPCKILSFSDEIAITQAIARQVTSEEVYHAIQRGSKYLDQNYYEEGCLQFFIHDLCKHNATARSMMDELLANLGLKKVEGGVAISVEQLSDITGISIDKASMLIQQLKSTPESWLDEIIREPLADGNKEN